MKRWTLCLPLILLGLALLGALDAPVFAADEAPPTTPAAAAAETPAPAPDPIGELTKAQGDIKVAVDTVWTLVAAFLVFFMNLGFAMVESGLARAKNCVNILAKNFIVFACASLAYLILGWGLMFGNAGDGALGKFVGTEGVFFVSGPDYSPATLDAYTAAGEEAKAPGAYAAINWAGVPLWTKFFFQLVFAGTAATIVSGAVAERIKFGTFIVFSFVLCGLIYPVIGHMIWGGGLMASFFKDGDTAIPMFDFAGSTVVHSCGGWAALAGVIVLGPRLGKYGPNGETNTIPGHNMTSVTLGGLVLWFGWFGFNPGSTMGAVGYADAIGHIAVTTNMAAAAATISSAVTAWLLLGKPDLSMIINGTLAGLVAITAGCAFVSVGAAVIIGLIAGVIVVFAVLFFDKAKLDDPVGALSVHLVNGVFGTLCVGLFADPTVCSAASAIKPGLFNGGGTTQLMPQIVGIIIPGAIVFVLSLVTWLVLKATLGLRVSDHEQVEGLDLGEHNMAAYPDFQITSIKSYHIREA